MMKIVAPAASLLLLGAAAQQPEPAIRLTGATVQAGLVRGVAPAGTVSLELDGRPVPLARDGRFILGFDRDAAPTARLTARLADERVIRQPIAVGRRTWRIQHINMARGTGGPSPEYARIREAELARIGAARRQGSDSMGWSQNFAWPARGRLSGAFGAQRIYRGGVPAAYHSGTDIAAGSGAMVAAPADGVVVLAPPPGFSLEGNLVILDHGMGLSSAFLHLSRASVRAGDRVRQGQEIGRVGATGRATGPHLHWTIMWNGARLDPQTIVGGALSP
jgi:murein DD-endopeptidase MepM/ murein hydrolase activator NlpD